MHIRISQLVILTAVCSGNALFGAEFRILGKLRPTDLFSDAYGVSADGSTVVGVSHTGAQFEAVRWTVPGGIQSMGAGQPSIAYGVSSDGSVIVGGRLDNEQGGAFRWTADTGLVGLGDLPGGPVGSTARDVSADGSVVIGTSTSANGSEAFRWTSATGMVGLGTVPWAPFGIVGTAVSANGAVVAGDALRVDPALRDREAFRWTAESGIIGLGDLPGGQYFSEAFDLSGDGSVVVGRSVTNLPDYFAFRWTEPTGMVQLPPTADGVPFRSAEGISGDGSVIVGLGAFVWDDFHGTRNLEELVESQGVELDGWSLEVGRSASYDGLTIVGLAFKPGVGDQAFLVRLDPGTFIPEPSTEALAVLGIMAVFFLVLRRSASKTGGQPVPRLAYRH